jgi:hypothetical protein
VGAVKARQFNISWAGRGTKVTTGPVLRGAILLEKFGVGERMPLAAKANPGNAAIAAVNRCADQGCTPKTHQRGRKFIIHGIECIPRVTNVKVPQVIAIPLALRIMMSR